MRAVLLLIVTMALLFGKTAEACSIGLAPPLSSIPAGLVAFVGVVEGDALPLEWLKGKPPAPGLRVRVTEAAASSLTGMVVDVYPFGHRSDCKSEPYDSHALQALYSPGTTISVVGGGQPGGFGFPTVIRTSNHGVSGMSIVPTAYPLTANGTLDFARASTSLRSSRQPNSSGEWERLANVKSFQYYEFYKSLALLEGGLDESRKVRELENIRYYGGYACMKYESERDAYVALVRNARLTEPAQKHILDSLPTAGNAGQPSSLKGTVFEGYCEER